MLEDKLKSKEIYQIVKEAEKKNISWQKVSKTELSNIIDNDKHQGIIAKVESYQYRDFEEILSKIQLKKTFAVLILDHLFDPQNLGSILRSAHAFGVDLVILPKDRSVNISPTVVRLSAGSSEYLSICKEANLNRVIKEFKKIDAWVFGADLTNGQDINNVEFDKKTVLVMGSEKKGMSRLVKDNCDYLVKIPINKDVDSLNVSAAASIILYEINQQQE